MTDEFEKQLCSNQKWLLQHACRLTGNIPDAQELAQDACVNAMRYRANFDTSTNMRPWLYVIIRNLFLVRLRRSRVRYMDSMVSAENLEETLASDDDHAKAYECRQIIELLDKCDMSDEFKEAIRLVRLDELSYDEAAAKAGVPVGTMKSRLHRATEAFRHIVGVDRDA